MKNLIDFDISSIFSGMSPTGIGTISTVNKEGKAIRYNVGNHSIEIEQLENSFKITFDPESLDKELLVPHKEPSGKAEVGKYKIHFPREGDRFRLSIDIGDEPVLTQYASEEQLGFLNLGDEFYQMFTLDEKSGYLTISMRIPTHYGIYGLGESFTPLNKRGTTIYTFPTDNYCLNAKQVYKGIPFFLSNAGFGVVFPHYQPMKFDLGDTTDGLILISVPARSVSFYLLLGSPREIVSSFVGMFGEHPMPPEWSFGLWWSRWAGIGPQSLSDVKGTVDKFRDTRIPLDVVVIDPQWIVGYVPGVTQACSFDWDHNKFKTDNEVGDFIKSRGKRLALWINPYLEFYGTGYERLKDCLLTDKDGKVALVSNQDHNPYKPDRGMVDFTRKECAETWISLVSDLLKRSNAQTVISDFGETVPLKSTDKLGHPGYMLRNKLGDLYQVAAFKGVQAATGKGMIWGRSGSLQSINLPVKWGGDSNSTWEGMKTALRGALSASLSGSLFSAFDIGGFAGKPDKDLFLRWTAVETLFTYFKLQGTTEREPWAYDDKAVDAFRELTELRYSLMPYILAEARRSVDARIPLSRPLIFDFPEDPNTTCIDDEFMLGSSILVAPIMSESGYRKIYLPEGEWVYFYDGSTNQGGKWIEKKEGLGRVPFFIRKGTTLEMANGKGQNVEEYQKLPRVKRSF